MCDLMTTSWRSASVCQQFRDVAEPEVRLKELRGALPQGGRVAIVSQPRCLGASAETTERVAEETAGRLREAGFISIQRETLNLRPPVACVLAEAP